MEPQLDRTPKRLERIASGLVGTPYVAGGRDAKRGLDCWGVVLEFYRRAFGIDLPDPVSMASATCEAAPVSDHFLRIEVEESQPGDIGRFHVRDPGAGHLGIVLARKRILHPFDRAGVVVWPLRGVSSCYRYVGKDGKE